MKPSTTDVRLAAEGKPTPKSITDLDGYLQFKLFQLRKDIKQVATALQDLDLRSDEAQRLYNVTDAMRILEVSYRQYLEYRGRWNMMADKPVAQEGGGGDV